MDVINIRESLLDIDRKTYCKYDLTTLYEACNLDDQNKKKLVQYIASYEHPSVIGKFLETNAGPMMEAVADDLTDAETTKVIDDINDGTERTLWNLLDKADEEDSKLEEDVNWRTSPSNSKEVSSYVYRKIKMHDDLTSDDSRYWDFDRCVREGDDAKLVKSAPKGAKYSFSMVNADVDIDFYMGYGASEDGSDCWFVVDNKPEDDVEIEEGCCDNEVNEDVIPYDKDVEFNDRYFPRVNIADKTRYEYVQHKGKDFAYDRKHSLLIYLFKDDEEVEKFGDRAPWRELDASGLREENWDDLEARQEYLDEYCFNLDSESSYLAQDFIQNELPMYQNNDDSVEEGIISDLATAGKAAVKAAGDQVKGTKFYQDKIQPRVDKAKEKKAERDAKKAEKPESPIKKAAKDAFADTPSGRKAQSAKKVRELKTQINKATTFEEMRAIIDQINLANSNRMQSQHTTAGKRPEFAGQYEATYLKKLVIKRCREMGIQIPKSIREWFVGEPDPTGRLEGEARANMNKPQSWTDVYKQFLDVVESSECDNIQDNVEALYRKHEGEPAWDAAWKRWNEGDDYVAEAVATAERPMSKMAGTLSSVLLAHKDEVETLFDVRSAIEFLDRIRPEVKNVGYVDKVKSDLMRKRGANPIQYFWNIILKGDGEGTDKGGASSTPRSKIKKWARESVENSLTESWVDDVNRAADYGDDDFMDGLYSIFSDKAFAIVEKKGFTDVFAEPSTQGGMGADFFWAEKDGVDYYGSYDFPTEQDKFWEAALSSKTRSQAINACAKVYAEIILSSLEPQDEDEEISTDDKTSKKDIPTSGTTGDCTWTRDGTHLTISGNGAMGDCDPGENENLWGTAITSVTIEEGVTTIGELAFSGCESLTSVTMGDSVTTIGDWAFSRCASLRSIIIPDSVITIGYEAFKRCTSLTSVTIPDSVTSIGNYAFYKCPNLDNKTKARIAEIQSKNESLKEEVNSNDDVTLEYWDLENHSGCFELTIGWDEFVESVQDDVLTDMISDEEFEAHSPDGVTADPEWLDDYIKSNADEIFKRYEKKLLDKFRDIAQERANDEMADDDYPEDPRYEPEYWEEGWNWKNESLSEEDEKKGLYEDKESDETPYTHTQVFDELKLETRNFTIDGDTIRYYHQSEANSAVKILKKHYTTVEGPTETADGWYKIEFSGKKGSKKTESVETNPSDPFRDTNGKIIAAKWYASAYPDDEVGIEQLDGLYLDDILTNRSLVGHCDTQVRERVYAQLDRYIPLSKESPMYKEKNESKSIKEENDDDFSDEELANIYGGDTKNDIPDGLETPDETEARLNESSEDMKAFLKKGAEALTSLGLKGPSYSYQGTDSVVAHFPNTYVLGSAAYNREWLEDNNAQAKLDAAMSGCPYQYKLTVNPDREVYSNGMHHNLGQGIKLEVFYTEDEINSNRNAKMQSDLKAAMDAPFVSFNLYHFNKQGNMAYNWDTVDVDVNNVQTQIDELMSVLNRYISKKTSRTNMYRTASNRPGPKNYGVELCVNYLLRANSDTGLYAGIDIDYPKYSKTGDIDDCITATDGLGYVYDANARQFVKHSDFSLDSVSVTPKNVKESLDLDESASDLMIYLFPELTEDDKVGLLHYNLRYLGKNHGADGSENNSVVLGTEADLRAYAEKDLGYELHPDYLYYEDDFAGDIVKEDLQ